MDDKLEKHLRKTIQILRDALQFYADGKYWSGKNSEYYGEGRVKITLHDKGHVARSAFDAIKALGIDEL